MSTRNGPRPWILGSLAVYASSQQIAQEVYELVSFSTQTEPFGTVTVETGEEVDWVNMRSGQMPNLH